MAVNQTTKRTLPEHTVDAWTAIELSRQGSSSIWLPTTNDGATKSGTHPGDISSLVGRRLVVIENKAIVGTLLNGVVADRYIDLGSDWNAQHTLLLDVEEAGFTKYPKQWPSLGWVFYGLPNQREAVDGANWRDFPDWHRLVCPHVISRKQSIKLDDIDQLQHCWHSCNAPGPSCSTQPKDDCWVLNRRYLHFGFGRPVPPLTLRSIEFLSRHQMLGLPLGEGADVRKTLLELVKIVRAARRRVGSRFESTNIEIDEPTQPPGDDLTANDLLLTFARLVGASGHTTVAAI